jgi:hypothetical protein
MRKVVRCRSTNTLVILKKSKRRGDILISRYRKRLDCILSKASVEVRDGAKIEEIGIASYL